MKKRKKKQRNKKTTNSSTPNPRFFQGGIHWQKPGVGLLGFSLHVSWCVWVQVTRHSCS